MSNTPTGKLAPQNKHKGPGDDFFVRLVALLTSAVLFVVIFAIAGGLGFLLNWADATAFLPPWMIFVGKVVEGILFVVDCVGLVWSVIKHLLDQLRGK